MTVWLIGPVPPLNNPPIRIDINIPNNTPIIPPTIPTSPAFNIKIVNTSLFLAPIAFIIPISLVFSRTEVNIEFATPTAPTRSDIAATNPKNKVSFQ